MTVDEWVKDFRSFVNELQMESITMDRENVIKGLECHVKVNCVECPYRDGWRTCSICETLLVDALALLKEQEPKPPIHVHEEYPEHDWETDEDGKIDEWALNYEFHNGPGCRRCGYSFCMHCKPNGWNEEPCIVDFYQCPKCKKRIFKHGKNVEYCVNCGQEVKWE